jgi:hypothetical protein
MEHMSMADTSGRSSTTRSLRGINRLTVDQFAEARMEEFYNALRALVVPEEMISHRIRVVSWRPGVNGY